LNQLKKAGINQAGIAKKVGQNEAGEKSGFKKR
jgi:hypothetical protein